MASPSFRRWVFGCLLAATLGAQEGGRLPFSVVGPEQGLPPGSVACLAQDRQGFLWMGSENGLVRHAAGQWRQWTAEDGLPSAFVPQILAAQDGLWLSSLRGLVRFREGRIERATMDGAPSAGSIGRLALDRRGRVWATSGVDIFVQRDGLAFARQPWRPAEAPFAMSTGPVSGAVFVGSPQGVHAFLPDGGAQDWGPADGLPREGPTLVMEDGQGRLWAGAGRTLVMKAPGAARFTDQSRRLPGSLTPNSLPFLDRDGSLWLPTQNGILHLDGDRAEAIGLSNGLPFRWARALFRDAEGTLWVAGPSLARLEGQGRVWNYGSPEGAADEVVWWVTRDRQGRLLIGTDDGAAVFGPKGRETVPGTEGRRIKSVLQDREGLLWMAGTTGPTLWLRPGSRAAEVAPLGGAGLFVNCVMEDAAGQVWLGHTRRGLFRWEAAAHRLVSELTPEQLQVPDLGIFSVDEDREGRLWACSSAGLLVRGKDGAWQRFTAADGLEPHNIRGIAFLPDGSAWVQYQEPEGLTRVRVEEGHLSVMERRSKGHGLRTNLVYAVASDTSGRVWISTDQGLDRLDRPVHVGREDGMISEDGSVHALRLEEGRVWAGTGEGVVRYDDAPLPEDPPPPQAHLLEITRGSRILEPPFESGPIPHAEATVAFRVGVPAFAHEQGVRIQTRLLGLEERWQDLEGTLARYPALPGGRYRFETRAAQGEGPFGPVTGFDFRVRPPWWLTGWAFAAWGLLGVAAIYGLLQVRLAALARSKAALEGEVASRTEELRVRNAELSAALAQVNQLSGLLPICSGCKKIRDDRGGWNQLEDYISGHSQADFTHGICPDCARDMFPDMPSKPPQASEGPA